MTEQFTSSLRWARTTPDFNWETYDRSHDVRVGSGTWRAAASAPAYKGDGTRINPEEMLVAALSSCHMLTFLAIAAKKRFVVDRYVDDAVGVMEKNAAGKMAVTKTTLRPKVTFSGDKRPTLEELQSLHHAAHDNCFIANSVQTVVDVVVEAA